MKITSHTSFYCKLKLLCTIHCKVITEWKKLRSHAFLFFSCCLLLPLSFSHVTHLLPGSPVLWHTTTTNCRATQQRHRDSHLYSSGQKMNYLTHSPLCPYSETLALGNPPISSKKLQTAKIACMKCKSSRRIVVM